MIRNASTNVPLLIGLLLTAMILMTAPAGAQGTSGAFAGPISSRQLMRYAQRLHLSEEQRQALESIHDEYKRQFRVLRDGEIAAFLKEQQSAQGGIPRREVVEAALEDLDRLRTKIKALDERLFDRLLPILTDGQQSLVPRIRMARERQRYENPQVAAIFGRGEVDLSEIFLDLDLPPAAIEAADPMIAQYERRLTTLMRKQAKALIYMTVDMMDALEERGFVDVSQEELMGDPELLRRLVDEMQVIWRELNVEVAEIAADIGQLNRRTCKNVAAVLPEAPARSLRNAYYRQSYRQLAPLVGLSDQNWMAGALELDDLSDEQRQALAAAAADYQGRVDRLLDDGVELVEGYWRDFSPFEVDQDKANAFQAAFGKLLTRGRELESETTASLEQALGKEALAEIRQAAATVGASPSAPAAGEPATAQAGQPEEFLWSGDRFLPPRIGRRDINGYAEKLGFDQGLRDVLSALHADYVEQFEQLEIIKTLRQANRDLWQRDAETGVTTPPTNEMIEEIYQLRRRAIETITEVDAAFFDSVATVAGKEQENRVDRLRRDRLRRTFAGSATGQYTIGRDRSSEAGIDVAAVAASRDLSVEEMKRIEKILDAYRDNTIPAFRQRLEAQLNMQQVSDGWAADVQAAVAEDVAAVVALQQRYQTIMEEPTTALEKAEAAIIALNRRTLDEVLAALPREASRAVSQAYDRAAFPTIFEDPAAVDRHLTAAMELDDLSLDQRGQLEELAASYRPEYERLSRAMCEQVGPSSANVVGFDAEDFRKWQAQQQKMARLRYDRSELNARAISRLKAILREDQIQRIGGLPEPQEEDEASIFR
jgi:hypothetical protein